METNKRAAIFLAEGFEEVEALTTVDLLRRVDIYVDMISISNDFMVLGAHGICVKADLLIENLKQEQYDVMILPGGMPGTKNLGEHEKLMQIIKNHCEKEKLTAAICAAPSLLGKLDLLKNKNACCYPGWEKFLSGATVSERPVEISLPVITSRGLGTAIPFSLAIIETLLSKEQASKLANGIIAHSE